MKKVPLIQGSDEWNAWRLECFTASNAAAVMNCNPWFPRNQKALLKKITGAKHVVDNPYMAAGIADEEMIRSLLETITGVSQEPSCWETEEMGMRLGASLDCFNEETGIIWDIKRPNKGSASEYFETGKIPEHYYWQLIHQLICTPSKEAGLCIYAHDTGEIKLTRRIVKDSEEFRESKQKLLLAWKSFEEKLMEF
jgi:putative phage-type endonuclease